MATDKASLIDPTLLQFAERLIDKGMFPTLVVIGLFALIWKFGWPKFGAVHPPPPPNAVVEAMDALREELVMLREEFADAREDTHDGIHRLESKLDILLDRGSRK